MEKHGKEITRSFLSCTIREISLPQSINHLHLHYLLNYAETVSLIELLMPNNLFCSLSMPRALNSSFLSPTPNSRRPSPSDRQQPKFFAVLRRLRCEGNAAKPTTVNSEGGALAWTLPLPRHAQVKEVYRLAPRADRAAYAEDGGNMIQERLFSRLAHVLFSTIRPPWTSSNSWAQSPSCSEGAPEPPSPESPLGTCILHASNQTSFLWILYYVDQCNASSPCCRKSPCRFIL